MASASLVSDPATLRTPGARALGSALLDAWPRTSPIGAIPPTGYLGGAVAAHARIGSPLFSHTLFGVSLGVKAWGGPYPHSPTLRAPLTGRD